jgi:hypothetical protein
MELADGGKTLIRSDAKWHASKTEAAGWQRPDFDDSSWPAAMVAAKFGEGPWGNAGSRSPINSIAPQACGIGNSLLVVYALDPRPVDVHALSPNAKYHQTFFDPVAGQRTIAAEITTDARGSIHADPPRHDHDWVLLLDARASRVSK